MQTYNNYRIIQVSYKGATDYQGARLTLKDTYTGDKVTIGRQYHCESDDQALEYLTSKNFNIIGKSHTKGGDMLVIVDNWGDDFINLKGVNI